VLGLALLALVLPQRTLAAVSISGTWSCCGAGGASAQTFVIRDSGGSLSGNGVLPSGASFAVITGSVSGSSVNIVTTYEASFAAGYVATFVGTVSASGTSMSGTWTSNAGQSGTWTATLSGAPPEPEPTPKTGTKSGSVTAVLCTISTTAPSTSTCTAQVAALGAKRLTSPTGTVSFTAASGVVGSSCVLAATPGSPGISSCTVSYKPSASLGPGLPPPVSAHYSGDSNFQPSSGESSFIPRSVLVGEGPALGTVEAAEEGSVEGIPVVLTNPNPFAVSADEELTVSGYPPVAGTSAVTARTQVIGRVVLHLAPLQSVSLKIKLSRGGSELLRKHKSLHATLKITTKRNGRRARVSHARLTLES
jgi:hypothetical protein